ncbi:LysR substrate-binding domain-containing protein [uncultured Roseibium sp.]|uniref:LysR substrate-binding domain-containing protein n=1 Tax=uncultured Roseibium sp. TaxID=1936171 RepID=UPI002604B166|nr:LysR substrate-binding domain-containing protein [uncultured Roseibium sp.]
MHGTFDMAILSRLRFKQLALVASLEVTTNLHGSARELNLSQPGATKLLKEVEETLGVTLFERQSRGMKATAYGVVVARHARQIISETGRLKAQLSAMQRGEYGKVRLGAIMEALPGQVSRLLTNLMESSSGPQISLTVSTSDNLIAGLNEGALDFALGRPVEHLDMSGIRFEPLWQEKLAVVAAPGHPLAEKDRLGLKDLDGFSWILQPRPSPMRMSIDLAFARADLPAPHYSLETSSMLMTTVAVGESDLLAVLPQSVATYYSDSELIRILPVQLEEHMSRYGLLIPNKDEFGPEVEALVSLVRSLF